MRPTSAPVPPLTALGPFKILALDVDGTLLDREGVLRPSTVAAVARAAAAGIRPVLCTGRRYRRARPIAVALGLDAPLVCNSGALVKNPADGRTVWRATLDDQISREVLEIFRQHGEPALSFLDHADGDIHDFLIAAHPTGFALFDDYVTRNREHAGIDPGWMSRVPPGRTTATPAVGDHFHLCVIGARPDMLRLESRLRDALSGHIRTFVQKSPRYDGTMCEVLATAASKWSAVLHLAELWGVEPREIVAVGDDMNDVPMIHGAGLGVAMGHAPAAVLDVADHVTDDHDNDGVARLIDDILPA